MDAYVFAREATPVAVAALRGQVRENGPIRVVCPLTGDRALYVALTGDDPAAIAAGVTTVMTTSGVSGIEIEQPLPGDLGRIESRMYPTYCAVDSHIGFTKMSGVQEQTLVDVDLAGVTVTGGNPTVVVVEVTGPDATSVQTSMAGIAAAGGWTPLFTAHGATADGAGFGS